MPPITQQPRRANPRLRGHNYRQSGAYFVTLCTQERACLFGDVEDSVVRLGPAGLLVAQCWQAIPTTAPAVQLDAWVVMPNHLHGILIIDCLESTLDVLPLGRLVAAFKVRSTKLLVQLGMPREPRIWQRNYYDHVLRDERALERVRAYILANPSRWHEDAENPARRARGPGTP